MVLKMILRSWMRHPLNTFISVISLTIGLVCSVLLLLFYLSELQVAKSMIKAENVHVMMSQADSYTDKVVVQPNISNRKANAIAESFPEVEKLALATFAQSEFIIQREQSSRYRDNRFYFVTPSICDLIQIRVKDGDLYSTLSNKNELAITSVLATKLFGTPDAMGRTIEVSTLTPEFETVNEVFTVTTILDDSRKQLLNCAILSGMSPEFVSQSSKTQISSFFALYQLKKGLSVEQFFSKMKADTVFWNINFADGGDISFRPLEEIYFASESDSNFGISIFNTREPFTLLMGMAIALVVLLIAAFNYVNITLTRANDRLKSIAGQRIMGATPFLVRWQTVLDTSMQVILAFFFSLLLIKGAIPVFNSFMGADLYFTDIFRWDFVVWVCALLFCLVLIPSLYILVKLEVRQPLEVFLKQNNKRIGVARNMLILQFIITCILIAIGLNIRKQINYICETIPNTNRYLIIAPDDCVEDENLYNVGLPHTYVDYIKSMASVNGIVPGSMLSMSLVNNGSFQVSRFITTPEYFSFFGLKLVEGRIFSDAENKNNVIVNQALLRKMELKPPYTGQQIDFRGEMLNIIGVVEDFRYSNVKDAIDPMVIWPYKISNRKFLSGNTISFSGNEKQVRKDLINKWIELYPKRPVPKITRLDVAIMEQNIEVQRMGIIVGVFSIISIALALMGMFGIAWYTVAKRKREIGLRKIHGASSLQIIMLLCRSFFVWIGIAMVIALPVAYYLTGYWLEGFTYRISNSLCTIILTMCIISVLTFCTVIWQTYRAAHENPASSIKES